VCTSAEADFSALPGATLVGKGTLDLERGAESIESLLVSIGAPPCPPRLRGPEPDTVARAPALRAARVGGSGFGALALQRARPPTRQPRARRGVRGL